MRSHQTSVNDDQLIQIAHDLIQRRFIEDRHHIAAALRTRSGAVFSGVHIEAHVGRVAVCAEAIAIGSAATTGDTDIEVIVAVNQLGEVLSPCGMCRELIGDYSPKARVIISRGGQHISVPVTELLPDKYRR